MYGYKQMSKEKPPVRNDVESVQDGRFEVQKNSYIINNV